MALLQRRVIHPAVAHQRADHLAAQAVVVSQAVALVHRQQALVEPRVILRQLLHVLPVGIADLADGRDAQGNQVTVGVGRVTLEVALQGAVVACDRELVVRQGKVVHADIDVARLGQPLDGQFKQLQLALGWRHVLAADQPLRAHPLREMGIAVGGDAVRAQGDDLAQRGVETLHRLQRQAVDQVHRHRLETRLAGRLYQVEDLLLALHAVDRLLHLLVEILHAETQAVEALGAQLGDAFAADGARVDFDGELVGIALVEIEMLAQAVHHLAQLLAGQVGRRAAAQMQLGELARPVEQRRLQGDLALEILQVLHGAVGLLGDDLVAGAVVAEALAERDVDVHRERLGRALVAALVAALAAAR